MAYTLSMLQNICKQSHFTALLWLVFSLGLPAPSLAAAPVRNPVRAFVPPNRILGAIDENNRVTLTGNRHPRIDKSEDLGLVGDAQRIEHIILSLAAAPPQNQALEQRLATIQDPSSAEYGKFFSVQEFEQQYGVSGQDIDTVVQWLTRHGFTVDEIPAGRRSVVFSGSVMSIRQAFHTDMHHYRYKGERHIANNQDPEIPDALSGVVNGIVSLHDFRSNPMHTGIKPAPAFTSNGSHAMSPADFYTIYNLKPVAAQNITGAGRSVAILGRTNIVMADIQQFQSTMNLPANLPQVILNGADPGRVAGDEGESDLDLEWAGAMAPGAGIKFVTTKSTATTDGIDASAQYAVSNNVADVISLSYGLCEADLGAAANSFYNNLWQQATAQGMTVFVSSGDSGSADCDSSSASTATRGLAVNGLCSSPYSTCVGGTEFNDTANPGQYWAATNNSSDLSSALSYIPEVVWNESGSVGGTGLWASGGGASSVYSKPAWQTGLGIPADGKRDVPDVSLTAASHDGYLVYSSDGVSSPTRYVFGGTSASAPSFAGIMALINHKTGYRQGNANPRFYQLAALQAGGGPAIYHQITSGNNSVPNVTGFSASISTPYYNQATGLGSVDGNVLVNHWTDVLPTSTTTVTANLSTSTIGQNVTFTATVTGVSPTGSVQFKDGATNLGGVVALVNGVAVTSTGALAIGGHTITGIYSGDQNNNASVSSAFNLNVNKAPTAVALSSSTGSLPVGQPVTFTVRISGRSPSGTLEFLDGAASLGFISVNGCVNSFTTSGLSAGSHTITVVYSGDANNLGSTSSTVSENIVTASSIQLNVTPTSVVVGAPVSFTATVSGFSPTGVVQFSDGINSLSNPVALVNGIASLSVASLPAGNHSIGADYSGDAVNTAGTSAKTVVAVSQIIPSLTLSSSNLNVTQGAEVSFTASVSGYLPSGQVVFFDGGVSLGQATLNVGMATLATSALSVGGHAITASYAGDINNTPVNSAVLTQDIVPIAGIAIQVPLPAWCYYVLALLLPILGRRYSTKSKR